MACRVQNKEREAWSTEKATDKWISGWTALLFLTRPLLPARPVPARCSSHRWRSYRTRERGALQRVPQATHSAGKPLRGILDTLWGW